MVIPSNPVQALIEILEALRLAKYLSVAVFTFILYDIALTYGREVQLIWGSRWTLVRVLFTITRYFVPCVLILNISSILHPHVSAKVCRVEMRVLAAACLFCNAVMMCILLLRVWAIWDRNTWVLLVLGLVFASSQLPALLIGQTFKQLEFIENPLPGLLTGCVVTPASYNSTHWVQLFVSSLAYESILFLLTVARAWSLNRRGVGTPIMALLTRDGAWYFLVVIVSVGLAALGTLIPETQIAALSSQYYLGIMACTCCRLLLRLREFYAPTNRSAGDEGLSPGYDDISLHQYSLRPGIHAPLPCTPSAISSAHRYNVPPSFIA